MTPPIWLDGTGRPRPTRPCWTCGREVAPMRFRAEALRPHRWAPPQTLHIPDWCGCTTEYLPIPKPGGWSRSGSRMAPRTRYGAMSPRSLGDGLWRFGVSGDRPMPSPWLRRPGMARRLAPAATCADDREVHARAGPPRARRHPRHLPHHAAAAPPMAASDRPLGRVRQFGRGGMTLTLMLTYS
jgi:hypothetical protein